MELFAKVKSFLLTPTKAFKAERKTELGAALKYGLIGLAFMAILSSIVMLGTGFVFPVVGATAAISIIIFVVILGFIGLLIFSLWMHLWVYVFGGRKGLTNTVKAVFYSQTPSYYLGWIPIVNLITKIWGLVLLGIGLIPLQKLSKMKAAGAVIVAIVIPIVAFIAIILWIVSIVGVQFLADMQQFTELQ